MNQELTICNCGPYAVHRPGSLDDLTQLVRAAKAEQGALFPFGGQTRLQEGLPPQRTGTGIDMRSLSNVVDYPARDMTITVEAGMTVAKLQEVLATENQRLPVDIFADEEATIGGSLATNTCGPRRFGCGTFRDYLIGISVVNDEGQTVKAGGRVVKNVAGYDLGKLFIGSWGTLGILAQATFKVVPKPEEQALVHFTIPTAKIGCVLDALHESQTQPICIELLNASLAKRYQQQWNIDVADADWVVVVGFESKTESVRWQVQRLICELKTDFPLEAKVGPTTESLWQCLTNLPHPVKPFAKVQVSMLPGDIADFCRHQNEQSFGFQVHAGSGVVHMFVFDEMEQQAFTKWVTSTRNTLATRNGTLVVKTCPDAWRTRELLWGQERNDLAMMRKIKQQLDPDNLFNPGRFLL